LFLDKYKCTYIIVTYNLSLDIGLNTILSTKRWLQFNVEPLDEILTKWKETSKYRKQFLHLNTTNIADIIENWPMYKQSFGHQLVNELY